jgi:hypothetical protein
MENQGTAFVIMQIGNKELDKIYSDIFVTAIVAANLEPKRIDKDNEGQLLKKEIVENIEKAEIIIADLTNERPNCYLEVGYAMGLDKYKNLIITVREDHYPESPNFKKGGPRIHFDLAGYDILFWDPNNLEEFKIRLADRISRRLLIISPKKGIIEKPLWNEDWLESQRSIVKKNLQDIKCERSTEILISPLHETISINQLDLLDIADYSQIQASGWPIAIVFKNVPKLKPVPKTDGILSEVHGDVSVNTYDFSYFRKNGQIFLAASIYEDRINRKSIIPDARLEWMTELLIYLSRFYTKCNLGVNESIRVSVRYMGLKGSSISSLDGGIPLSHPRTSMENDCTLEIITSISEIETKLPELVHKFLNGLFVLFDFYSLNIEYVKLKVNEFVAKTNRYMR